MNTVLDSDFAAAARDHARPFPETKDLGPLIDRISGSRVVMFGEASHGTHEYYDWRRMISEWLIVKHGFDFIAVEGDWPSCIEVNRFVRGQGGDRTARETLGTFRRWPTWMWANTETLRLMQWMEQHREAGFYGLDVYSLFDSIDRALHLLEGINPFLARRARNRYSCFAPFDRDEHAYARSLLKFPDGCEDQVSGMLTELLKSRFAGANGVVADPEEIFDIQQNARVILNAEHYYRALVHADESSWNVRDHHMLETLEQLLEHHSKRLGRQAKAIVWAHNTHIGDHRYTDMSRAGLVNLGGLARCRFGQDQVSLVGFGTYEGRVVASHAWEGPIENLVVPPARQSSTEALLHQVCADQGTERFFMLFDEESRRGALADTRGHRAIGVVYDPAQERWGNYVPTSLANRYDAFMFFDRTKGVQPLIQSVDRKELPETWPMGT